MQHNATHNGASAKATVHLEPEDPHRLASLCGHCNEHLQQIERQTGVVIYQRGHLFHLDGGPESLRRAERVLVDLYQQTRDHQVITPGTVHLHLQQNGHSDHADADAQEPLVIHAGKRQIRTRGEHQRQYAEAIHRHDLTFGIGPAGTGKTFLAVACAIRALQAGQVDRVVLVRPAVEAGEKLGFLPGDLEQKVNPYLRPIYDALDEMLGPDKTNKLMEQHTIEVAPLAYMRGRTLNNAFVILDEGQNTSVEQMKMLLTRIGYGSKAVIAGDPTQVDLPSETTSGLRHAVQLLSEVPDIAMIRFQANDTLRHPLVRAIVSAYQTRGEAISRAIRQNRHRAAMMVQPKDTKNKSREQANVNRESQGGSEGRVGETP